MKNLIFAVIIILVPSLGFARPIITDLSERKIDINAGFTGKDILLYGTRVEAGQVVIVVRGPETNFMVRKKERVAGMWINTGAVKFYHVPQFYRIAASRDLNKLDAANLLSEMNIEFARQNFNYKTKESKEQVEIYRKAMVEKLQKDELVDFEMLNLPFLEGTLFRIRVNFPEKVPQGTYTAEIYAFNEGQLIGMQAIPIRIEKVGIEATIYNLAQNSPALYGILAILLAASMGYAASHLFRKV